MERMGSKPRRSHGVGCWSSHYVGDRCSSRNRCGSGSFRELRAAPFSRCRIRQQGNQVVAFARASDGTLSHVGDYATGGQGSGAGLGSQGSVRLSDDGSWLLVVNAGSDEVSVFAVSGASLNLTDTVSSGGDSPISVDVHEDLVYVLNAGSANIAGFRLTSSGELAPVRGPIRSLSAPDAAPAQIEFSPDGSSLAVTEKNTNLIVTYGVSASGVATPGKISESAGSPRSVSSSIRQAA